MYSFLVGFLSDLSRADNILALGRRVLWIHKGDKENCSQTLLLSAL